MSAPPRSKCEDIRILIPEKGQRTIWGFLPTKDALKNLIIFSFEGEQGLQMRRNWPECEAHMGGRLEAAHLL